MFMTLTGKLSRQRLRRSAVDFYSKKIEKNRSLRALRGNYALHLWLIGKPVVDFIFVVIEHFFGISYGGDVISGNPSESAFFETVGHFERRFQREGGVAHQPLWVSE